MVKPFVLVAKLKALEWFYTLLTRSMCWDNLITEVCVEFLDHFFSCFVAVKVVAFLIYVQSVEFAISGL